MRTAEVWVDHVSTNDIRDSSTTLISNIVISQLILLNLPHQILVNISNCFPLLLSLFAIYI
jgi:hypothetical protein